jgi:hypothetical protein
MLIIRTLHYFTAFRGFYYINANNNAAYFAQDINKKDIMLQKDYFKLDLRQIRDI